MGISRVSLGDKHFDAPDAVLEVWLRLLVNEIDAINDAPEWLRVARDDWQLLATEQFGFGSAPDLDSVVTDNARRELLAQLAKRALSRLEGFGNPIPKETLNALGVGKQSEGFARDLAANVFVDPARAFLRLLEDGD